VSDPVRLAWPAPRREPGGVGGEVIHVDGFGNLVTNLRCADLAGVGAEPTVEVAGMRWRLNTIRRATAGECSALSAAAAA
jgi:S-adenosylmethionine hydrolase